MLLKTPSVVSLFVIYTIQNITERSGCWFTELFLYNVQHKKHKKMTYLSIITQLFQFDLGASDRKFRCAGQGSGSDLQITDPCRLHGWWQCGAPAFPGPEVFSRSPSLSRGECWSDVEGPSDGQWKTWGNNRLTAMTAHLLCTKMSSLTPWLTTWHHDTPQ